MAGTIKPSSNSIQKRIEEEKNKKDPDFGLIVEYEVMLEAAKRREQQARLEKMMRPGGPQWVV